VKALLVGASPVRSSVDLVVRLAEEADVVLAVDGGGTLCLEAGIVPDRAVGDFDSLPGADFEALRDQGVKIRDFPADKDASDLELAVAEARSLGATSLVLTAVTGGRLDHSLATLGTIAAACDLGPRVVECDCELVVLSAGRRACVCLEGAGATFSVMAYCGGATVTVSGATWSLSREHLDPCSSRGLSNRIDAGGQATVSSESGIVLVVTDGVASIA